VVALLSIALLTWIAREWKGGSDFDLMFAAGTAASLLSGAHMFTQDFSPLIPSMYVAGLALRKLRGKLRVVLAIVLIVFWTFPLYLFLIGWHCLYLMAIALLAFTWACVRGAELARNRQAIHTHTVAAG